MCNSECVRRAAQTHLVYRPLVLTTPVRIDILKMDILALQVLTDLIQINVS